MLKVLCEMLACLKSVADLLFTIMGQDFIHEVSFCLHFLGYA